MQHLTARDYKDARDLVVTHDGRVRGLSAEEYEIAMGFPVGHTAIPGATLAKRRKALGNSMSVESMHWLGQLIRQAVLNAALAEASAA